MRAITIVNQKGGSGKTTTAINLAATYAGRGQRTLLVDLDPQSHCAVGLGVPQDRLDMHIGQALLARHDESFMPSRLVWEVARNLDLAPSSMALAGLEAPGGGLHQMPDKDRRLQSLLTRLEDQYDICLIDCSPTIGLLTFNGLRAAREALIPVETGYFSFKGAHRQWDTIRQLIDRIDQPIACHILPTLHKRDSQLSRDILSRLRREFAGQILPLVIHDHETLREAASFGQPVHEYAPECEAQREFEALADWLDTHDAQPHAPAAMHSTGDPDATMISSQHARFAEHVTGYTSSPSARQDDSSRAAELVARVRQMVMNAQPQAMESPAAPQSHAPEISETKQTPPAAPLVTASASGQHSEEKSIVPAEQIPPRIAPLLGVHVTTQGVLFIQPGQQPRRIYIAGDFNGWSSTATPMRFSGDLEIYRALIKLPPGEHRYRLIVDGKWQADPHNEHTQPNAYNEPMSIVTVPTPAERTDTPPLSVTTTENLKDFISHPQTAAATQEPR